MERLIKEFRESVDRTERSITLKRALLIIGILILLVLGVRIAFMHVPSLEWTAWKEIDYLYISKGFASSGFNFFAPSVGWPAEPPRVTEMEFPLVPYAAAILYKIFGYSVYSARAVTAFAFLLLMVFVFRLVNREVGTFTALVAAFASGVLPLFHPFGKILFTEPLMIAMSVVSLFYLAEWMEGRRRTDAVLAVFSLSLTFALKIETLYLLLPVSWIIARSARFKPKEYLVPGMLVGISLILPLLWYSYAFYLESVGAHVFGIFRGHNKMQTLKMLTEYLWYREMALRVIFDIFGGVLGTLLFLAGLIVSIVTRKGGLFFFYLASIGCYFVLVAEGNIDAPYRQLTLVPAASFYIAFGAQSIFSAIAWLVLRMKNDGRTLPTGACISGLIACLLIVAVVGGLNTSEILAADTREAPRDGLLPDISRN